jgi:hypothetical protein
MSDLPSSVQDMEYADPDWLAAAAKPAAQRTALEVIAFTSGPRPHPFGPNVHTARVGENMVHFADKEAYHSYMAEHPEPQSGDVPALPDHSDAD